MSRLSRNLSAIWRALTRVHARPRPAVERLASRGDRAFHIRRLRFGDPPNEVHADLTFGVRPVPRFLLLAQSFNTWSDGRGKGVFDRYRYHNLQASAVLDLDDHWSIQAGALGTAGGKNALRERGLLFGLWRKF